MLSVMLIEMVVEPSTKVIVLLDIIFEHDAPGHGVGHDLYDPGDGTERSLNLGQQFRVAPSRWNFHPNAAGHLVCDLKLGFHP
jgi:hypothetical protein